MKAELCNSIDCTGCMACLQTCRQEAIKMEWSNDGFSYPQIDAEKCVGCQACVKACPVLSLQPPYYYNNASRCYSAYQKEKEVRMGSSSGGLFFTLSKYIIEQGGVVFGAGWTDHLHLKHLKAEKLADLKKLMRSKYVQSDTSEVFAEAKRLLESGEIVLFCGTPCQIAAMRSFLRGKDYENLYLVDVVCQGVPSPVLFRKYIDEVEAKCQTTVTDVIFRSKKYGWRCGLLLLLLCSDGRTIEIRYKNNTFYRAFLKNYMLRESCYHCQFKYPQKGCFSDITLADFWRIGSKVPFKCNSYESGVSAVLTNTFKGERLFDAIKNEVVWEERTYDEFSTNGGLRVAEKPRNNEKALATAKTEPFAVVQEKFYPYTWKQKVRDIVNMHLSQRSIFKIKKWIGR